MSLSKFHIEPLDVPPAQAARRMGLSLEAFNLALDGLHARGFPAADPTTGNYDLEAIDIWRRRRHDGGGGAAGFAVKATPALTRERLARL